MQGVGEELHSFPVEKDDKLIKSMDQNILNVLKVEAETMVFLKTSNINSQPWVASFATAIAFGEIIASKMAKKLKELRFQLSIDLPQRGLVTRDLAGKTTENGELHIAGCEVSVSMTITNPADLLCCF